MHDYEAKFLHLVYPGLVLFPKSGNGRPLVLSPKKLSLVWIFDWAVQVDSLVIISQAEGHILL